MKKAVIQGFVVVFTFATLWFGLSQIDWTTLLKVEKVTDKTEEKLGDLFWESYKQSESQINNPFIVSTVDSIVNKICKVNNIERESIKVHVFEKDEINAFALPNGHLVIYSGLILSSENQEELSGVICHELAHIKLNHVMKKLVKEVGLSVLISITTSNGGTENIKQIAKGLSSSAFDRSMEKEADIKAVDYLLNAKIDPLPFANFLYQLSETQSEMDEYFAWVSTHPDSKQRAEYIIEYCSDKKTTYEPVLANQTWVKLKEHLKED